MKLRIILLLSLLILPVGAIALGQGEAPESWEIVGEGIEYQKFHLNDPVPVDVFVARMARNNPNTAIESSIGQGRLAGGTETVSSMAARYDEALNYWGPPTIPVTPTWGSTNDVVVAINGYFYGSPNEDVGVPWSGQIHSGWYAKRFYDLQTNTAGSGFAWRQDRSVFIGGCVSHPNTSPNYKQFIDFDEGAELEYQPLDGINIPRADNELVLYTPQYDRDTNTKSGSGSLEVLVEMFEPTMLTAANDLPFGIVRKIQTNNGSTPIPYDHIVLAAHGTAADTLAANVQVGDTIGISQKIKHYLQNQCDQSNPEDWIGTYASLAGSYYFLRNSVIYDFASVSDATFHQPRTAIAYNDDFVFFIVADGRNPGISEGMTIAELADFSKNTLGATHGIAQDGGGSSTMVINGEVVNNTYCNHTYCTPKIYLPLIVKSGNSTNATQIARGIRTEWDAEAQILQRLVANGMLMVVVQPEARSDLPLDPTDPVTTTGTIDVYLGPGTNYAILNTASGEGEVIASLNELGGIYAKGSYWWKVDFGGGLSGWVPEDNIIPLPKLRSNYGLKAR